MPERTVAFVAPQSKKFIEMRQMIRGIGKFTVGNEFDEMVFGVPHGKSGTGFFAFVYTCVQDAPCPGSVIQYPFAGTPAVGRKKQGHGKKFFAVRGGSIGIFAAVSMTGPGKIAGVFPFGEVHVGHDPSPQAVEFLLVIHLYAEHHCVGHALGTDVMVPRILYVHHVRSGTMAKANPLRTIEHLLKCAFQLVVNFGLRISKPFQSVQILPVIVGTFHNNFSSF